MQLLRYSPRFAMVLIILGLFAPLAAQTIGNIPRRPLKLKMRTRSIGPKPGSPVKEGNTNASYRKSYMYPAELVLLVRGECGTNLGRRELVELAEQKGQKHGAPLMVDWGSVKAEASYWAVVRTRREILDIQLSDKKGKYMITKHSKRKKFSWHTQKITISRKGNCLKIKELEPKALKVAVLNILTNQTLKSFRSASD